MPITNYPAGLSSFGIPIIPGTPPIVPGSIFFVKPSTGSDGNSGESPDQALKTLTRAHTLATANKNDIVYLMAEHGTTAGSTTDYQSATLTWSKNMTHLIGLCPPVKVSHRARIAQLSTATGVSPLVNVTADSCIFSNFSIFHGVADATSLIALQVTGQRNVFHRMHIGGVGHATMSAAGSCSLKLNGGDENVFEDCVIGLDTIARDADATEILLDGDATRNIFRKCEIISYISAAGFASLTVADATGIDRYCLFDDCLFFTKSDNKATAQTSVFSIPAISQGAIILKNTFAGTDGGAADWDSNNRAITWNNSVAAAASAAGGVLTVQ